MRIGIVDIGTNSLRFAIYEVAAARNEIPCVYKEKVMVRPGRDVFTVGRLRGTSVRKIVTALKHFKNLAKKRRVVVFAAFATSAFREAENTSTVLKAIYKQTGVEVQVISGELEAKLIARGILANEHFLEKVLLVDIGGGSTELSLCHRQKVIKSMSLRLGSQRLAQLFFAKSKIARDQQLKNLRAYVRRLFHRSRELKKFAHGLAVGSSGSLRALAKTIERSHNPQYYGRLKIRRDKKPHFTRSSLKNFIELIDQLKPAQFKKLPGLDPKRADLILPTSMLIEELMDYLQIEVMHTTDFSLRDGLILHVLDDHA